MAITSSSYTFDAIRLPHVNLTVEVLDTTGQTFYTAEVSLTELDPSRTTTAEERTAGISGLNPPTVRAQTPQTLINLAIRACSSAYDSTPGFTLTPDVYASLTYSVAASISGALNLAGVDS